VIRGYLSWLYSLNLVVFCQRKQVNREEVYRV